MSAVSYVEAAVSSTATEIRCLADDSMTYCAMSKSSSSPYHLNQARIAREAYRDFGKGRHRAGLNLGLRMLWRRRRARRCYSKGMSLAIPTLSRPADPS
jgi:uncharacterized protein with PIN domain